MDTDKKSQLLLLSRFFADHVFEKDSSYFEEFKQHFIEEY